MPNWDVASLRVLIRKLYADDEIISVEDVIQLLTDLMDDPGNEYYINALSQAV